MNRKANWIYSVEKNAYVVTLIEEGHVVHQSEYKDQRLAELAKESWLSGQGPEFLVG